MPRGEGRPLDGAERRFMERAFAHDFSRVRVHDDGAASASAQALSARAYTVGDRVVLGSVGAPGTPERRRVLAHELTHVVQGARTSAEPGKAMSERSDPAEVEADVAADRAARGEAVRVQREPAAAVQRLDQAEADSLKRAGAAGAIVGGAVGLAFGIPKLVGWLRNRSKAQQQKQAAPTPAGPPTVHERALKVKKDLPPAIKMGNWRKGLRPGLYARESAPGIARARARHEGRAPDLKGVGSLPTLAHFAAAMHRFQREWPSFHDRAGDSAADQRLHRLVELMNVELDSAGVPRLLTSSTTRKDTRGAFDPQQWGFIVNLGDMQRPDLSDEDAADLANTALHEARHAEQTFLAARFAAQQHVFTTPLNISNEVDIPLSVAMQATAKKFTSRTDPTVAAMGRQMFQTVVTDAAHTAEAESSKDLDDMEAACKRAAKALDALQKQETMDTVLEAESALVVLRVAIAEVVRRYPIYRALPNEADAHEVGDAEEQAFKGWPGSPPRPGARAPSP
jgi:hypothetical protein